MCACLCVHVHVFVCMNLCISSDLLEVPDDRRLVVTPRVVLIVVILVATHKFIAECNDSFASERLGPFHLHKCTAGLETKSRDLQISVQDAFEICDCRVIALRRGALWRDGDPTHTTVGARHDLISHMLREGRPQHLERPELQHCRA